MHIFGFHIEGFGIFKNQSVQDIPNGFVLFLGENESGKTTLMEFIRTILFGFPRRGTRNDYPPLQGGSHGGRLQVVMKDERRFTIERVGRQEAITEGEGVTERVATSERLLGGIDRQTFENVFAIGLKELQGLTVLSQESLRGRLLAAGAGLGLASIPTTLQTIDGELNTLLSQRGRQQLINKIVNRLREIRIQVGQLRGQAAEYSEYQRKQTQLEEQIKQRKTEAESIHQRLRRVDQLEQTRGLFIRLCTAREKAANLGFAKCFPPNGLERFENLKRHIEEIIEGKKAREDEAVHLEQQLRQIIMDETLLECQESIEALLGEREKLLSALNDQPILKSKMGQSEEEFQRRLRELGADWNPERLGQVDASVQVRQRVQEFGRQLDTLERKYEQAQANLRSIEVTEKEAKRIVDEAARRLDALPTSPIADSEQLLRKQEALQVMRFLFHQRDVATIQINAKRMVQQDLTARLESLKMTKEKQRVEQLPTWMPIVALMSGVGLAIVLAVQKSFVLSAIFLLAGVVLAGLLHRLCRRDSIRIGQLERDTQQLEQTQQKEADGVRTFEEQLHAINGEIERVAQEAGFKRPIDVAELERLAGELDRAVMQFREWMECKRKKDDAEISWRDGHERLETNLQERDSACRELQDLQDDWQRWLAERGFSGSIRPDGFEAVLQAVERARDVDRNLEELRQRIGRIEDYILEARTKIRTLLDACGRKPFAREVGVEDLDRLRRDLEVARDAQRQRQRLEEQLEAAHSNITRLRDQLENKQAEHKELLQQAGTADEKEFRRVNAFFEEWKRYSQQIETDEIALRTIVGTSEAQGALETELRETEPLQLQAEKDNLERRLKEVTDALSLDEREVGSVNERLAQMSRDGKLGELLFEQRTLQQQLSDATKRWATLVVCRHLLEEARGVYERERQPQVIVEAGRFLEIMTNSRYRLMSPVGEGSIQLEDVALRRKQENVWSSGLADQVYLAIRLGLAREFGRHAEPLPVILDDILVRFDPSRLLGAARIILEFAKEQQVLLFSCHPEFKDVIERACRDSQLLEVVVSHYNISDGMISRQS